MQIFDWLIVRHVLPTESGSSKRFSLERTVEHVGWDISANFASVFQKLKKSLKEYSKHSHRRT